jgi:hypothetical protein
MFEMFQSLRWTHVAFGSIALILFWIPVDASKGGRLHVRVGWAYAACMSVVVLTALTMSGLTFAFPFRVRNFTRVLSPEESAQFIRDSRSLAFFLAYLGSVTLAAGWQGIGVLRTRRNPRSFRNPFTYGLNIAVVLAAAGSLTLGILEHATVFVAMSSVGFLVGGGNLAYLLRSPQSKMHWWYEHLSSMIATAIAGYTAFIVFGGARLLQALARTQFYVLFWLLPVAIGVPAINLTVAHYKKKFHEDGRTNKPEQLQSDTAV